ncbi:hypothetical protein ECE50_029220 [Chitinophaga sp. Mgbs1]|uniref:Uncharacterized protein n=1 Tax=Chitinophaga solisilvae TaxID=1233460 RepID=A0A433WAU1_9BACT|nr:hypothetical protein [Chitinophaga solisilvae]
MKQTIYNRLCFFLLLAVCSSCYKDKGNYDYHPINEVTIQAIDTAYAVLRGDSLHIVPRKTFSLSSNPEDAYTYAWIAVNDSSKTLATTPELHEPVMLMPDNYELYYRITEKATGIKYEFKTELHVMTGIYEGWLLLNDQGNDNPRLDMLSKNVSGDFNFISDVLSFARSPLQLSGKPRSVQVIRYRNNNPDVLIGTSTGTTRIDPETFDWNRTMNVLYDMPRNTPADFAPDRLNHQYGITYLVDKGDLYYRNPPYSIMFAQPLNVVRMETGKFSVSPFVAVSMFSYSLLYDITNKRFLRHSVESFAPYCELMPESPDFDYNNTGMDLVYMERTEYNEFDVFSILKKPSGEFYLSRIYLFFDTEYETAPVRMNAPELDKASYYAVNPDYGYVFYSVGGKLYEYDFSSNQAKLKLDISPRVISCLQTQYMEAEKEPLKSLRKTLAVCSYDPGGPAGKSGRIDFYAATAVMGDLQLRRSFSGMGKVISMDYRGR